MRRVISVAVLAPAWVCAIFALTIAADAFFTGEPFTLALALLLLGGSMTIVGTTIALMEDIICLMRSRRTAPLRPQRRVSLSPPNLSEFAHGQFPRGRVAMVWSEQHDP
jgi:hypothetical protein